MAPSSSCGPEKGFYGVPLRCSPKRGPTPSVLFPAVIVRLLRRNVFAIILGVISGLLLVVTNTVGSPGFLAWIPFIAAAFGLPPPLTDLLNVFLTAIVFLAMLGGWTVILGCILVALGRHRTGAWLMSVGTGLSLVSLVWNLAQLWIAGSLTFAAFLGRFQGWAWAGAIMSVIAQELVKLPGAKKSKTTKESPAEESSAVHAST